MRRMFKTKFISNFAYRFRTSQKNIFCFVTRNKETGEYDRVMMDAKTNEVIYATKSLEEMAYEIDKLKVMKRFKM